MSLEQKRRKGFVQQSELQRILRMIQRAQLDRQNSLFQQPQNHLDLALSSSARFRHGSRCFLFLCELKRHRMQGCMYDFISDRRMLG